MLDLSHAHEIRFAALRAMEQLADEMKHDDGELWLAGVDPDTVRLLIRSESTLPFVAEASIPGHSVRQCLDRVEHVRRVESAEQTPETA